MYRIELNQFKRTYATYLAPATDMDGYTWPTIKPQIGDILAAEIISLGKHNTIETINGVTLNIFPGDRILGAFGYRYATDQYEGVVPDVWSEMCDLLSVGGVCGEVRSAHSTIGAPTRLRILGALCTAQGQPLNLRTFARPAPKVLPSGEVILVVGTSMNSGKTTTVGTLARSLSRVGFRVAAAKITGTAAGKDGRFFASCGANPVFDFTHCGLPSTAMLEREELEAIFTDLVSRTAATSPDYTILEIADGIFQRETRMLLESDVVRARVNHLFFAASDSLGAECGVRRLRADGWPLRAVAGLVAASPLASREVEDEVGVPCLSIAQLMNQPLLHLLGTTRTMAVGNQAGVAHAA
ncbi:MAG: DUF1611 domain-containing protein [Chloroflexaceae bacterium]|jgi:hypothetical protein|nr:DUF1611 domain-containing protein [Chloroflexaceae bacterium]